MKSQTFYSKTLGISDDFQSVCCIIQEGTGNTIETSNLVERWFPIEIFKIIFLMKIPWENI